MVDIDAIQKSTKWISAKNTVLEIEQAMIIDQLCDELKSARKVVEAAKVVYQKHPILTEDSSHICKLGKTLLSLKELEGGEVTNANS